MAAATYGQIASWHVLRNSRACSGIGALAYVDRCDKRVVTANKGIIFYRGWVFVYPIVVAGNGTSTNVYLTSHGSIANICQVLELTTLAHVAVFYLYEVTDRAVCIYRNVVTKVCKRPYAHLLTQATGIEHCVAVYHGAIADRCITQD